MVRLVCGLSCFAGALIGSVAAALSEESSFGGSRSAYRGTEERPQEEAMPVRPPAKQASPAEREKLMRALSRKLGQLPASKGKKKSKEDYFVVGTADIDTAASHADVRFRAMQKQLETARFLADYTLDAPVQTLRQWHVFSRFPSQAEADQFLQDMRAQYDAQVAYREQIAQIYRARTTRRC